MYPSSTPSASPLPTCSQKRGLFIDNLLVQIHLIIEMVWWTGLVP